MEALKLPIQKEEKGDEFELSLELSIGGSYGKTERNKTRKFLEQNSNNQGNLSRSHFGDIGGGLGEESMDQQRKKEIQALRRKEARKKRVERITKSRLVEDKVFLEAKKFHIRVRDREIREKEELGRKVMNGVGNRIGNEGLYSKSQHEYAHPSSRTPSNASSLERSSSDYQSTSQKGGSSSDTGSQSSGQHNHMFPRTLDHLQDNEPPPHAVSTIPKPDWSKFLEKPSIPQATNSYSEPPPVPVPMPMPMPIPTSTPSKETSDPQTTKPKNQTHNTTSPAPHIPCVSTTGNGPNGRTITGFLYKYTNNEVSIMCVCHGSSFSPTEFVEHAGGVNISNPLRHITIMPSSLGCP